MDLAELTARWETQEIAMAEELFGQYAGLPFREDRMQRAAGAIETLCREAVPRLQGKVPETLFHAMVSASVAKERTHLENEIYRQRNEEVAVTVGGERVTLNSVRLFNHKHIGEASLRRRVFDDLMDRTALLTPTLREKFELSRRAYAPFHLTPLDVYLAEEQIDLPTLKRVVRESAGRARPLFLQEAATLSPEVIGKPMEYFDDLYVFRHVIYKPVDPKFAKVDFAGLCRDVARRLGFGLESIRIDGEPRPGKYSSPVCFGIRIPGDVRVLYQRTSPFGDYTSFWHEMGHALHFAHVEAERSFHHRRLIPNGIAEIFSTLFEEVAQHPRFLAEELGLDDATIREIRRRVRFMDLYFLTFYGANSMFKIRFWEEELSMDEADEAYESLTEELMGVRIPGRYWQTHHIISMSDMYAPSYLLAHIRKAELWRLLEKRFGASWWSDPQAGEFLREECMGPGGALDLRSFSRLDSTPYLDTVLPA